MKYLIFCTCGHTVEDHVVGGCADASGGPCGCRLDQFGALEAAVERAKIEAALRGPAEPSTTLSG